LSHGLLAESFLLVGGVEAAAGVTKTLAKEKRKDLQKRYKDATAGSKLFEGVDASWLLDPKIKDPKDLSLYSLKGKSMSELSLVKPKEEETKRKWWPWF